jgi:copper transport protein
VLSATSRTKGTILLYFLLISISVFIATNSFTSHSSSVATWSQLGILVDFIHSVAVSIWVGGLMYILYVLFPNVITTSKNIIGKAHEVIAQPRSILLLILCRFSVISTICVGVIGITGLFLAWLHIQSMDELLLSDYGRTLIIKLSLVLPVVILGGYHQFWISKMVKVLDFEPVKEGESSKTKFSQRFSSLKTTLKIECMLAASVLCSASFLTVTTPPGTMRTNEVIKSISNAQMAAMQSEFNRVLETQGIPIRLVIYPFVTGFNNFTINIFGNNESIGQVSNVSIEFTKSDLSLGPITAKLLRNNDTAYSVSGGYISQAGEWDLKVTIKRFNLYDLNYRVSFPVNKSSDSIHDQHHVDTVEIADTPNRPSSFTPMVIGLSVIVAALSTYFCINALNRLEIIQQRIGLRN